MKLNMSKNKLNIVHIFSVCVILLVCFVHMSKLDFPTVLNDEFGYWANAVSLAGYDWSSLISTTPYYSWGYSILLVPIVVLLPSALWYKAAICLNVLLLIGSYYLCYNFGRKLFSGFNAYVLSVITLIVIIYPGNIVYAQESWSEILLAFMMWMIAYMLSCLDEHYSNGIFIVTSMLIGFMYIVHARTIGVVLVSIPILFTILIKHKKSVWYYLIPIIIFVALYMLNDVMKQYLIMEFYSSSSASNTNNVSINTATIAGYIDKLVQYFSAFVLSLFGKFIYLLIASGLTIIVGISGVIKELFSNIKKKVFFDKHIITKFWCVLSTIAMWGICSLQMLAWEQRKDMLVYSRYFENTVGPLFLLCFVYLIINIEEKRKEIILSGIISVIGIGVVCHYIDKAYSFFNSICAPVFGAFFADVASVTEAYGKLIAYCLGMLMILLTVTIIRNKKLGYNIILVTFFISYILIGYKGSGYVINAREDTKKNIVSSRENMSEYEDCRVYYVNYEQDPYCVNPKYLQFVMPNREIEICDRTSLKEIIKEDTYVMCHPKDMQTIFSLTEFENVSEVNSSSALIIYEVE